MMVWLVNQYPFVGKVISLQGVATKSGIIRAYNQRGCYDYISGADKSPFMNLVRETTKWGDLDIDDKVLVRGLKPTGHLVLPRQTDDGS